MGVVSEHVEHIRHDSVNLEFVQKKCERNPPKFWQHFHNDPKKTLVSVASCVASFTKAYIEARSFNRHVVVFLFNISTKFELFSTLINPLNNL